MTPNALITKRFKSGVCTVHITPEMASIQKYSVHMDDGTFNIHALFTVSMMENRRNIAQCTKFNINVTIPSDIKAKLCDIGEKFYAVWVMNVVVGMPYLLFTFSCVFKLIKRCTSAFRNPRNLGLVLHNLDYIICLFITAIGAIT